MSIIKLMPNYGCVRDFVEREKERERLIKKERTKIMLETKKKILQNENVKRVNLVKRCMQFGWISCLISMAASKHRTSSFEQIYSP